MTTNRDHPIAQLVEHCIGVAEVMGSLPFVSGGIISSVLCAGFSVGVKAVTDKNSKFNSYSGKVIPSRKPSAKFSHKC